jgi:DUF971 family protein
MKYKPSNISVNRITSEMTITWNDGHVSVYSFSLLRHACPCADCRGGHENMSPSPDPKVFTMPDEDSPSTHIRRVDQAGTYGIIIEWEDGHNYGIYNWGYLRELCPCPICRPDQA